jgi:ApeA N-terminal domain 1
VAKESPLKPRLEAGEYECHAHLPDGKGSHSTLGGMLSLESDRPPVLSLHGDVPVFYETVEGGRSASFPQNSHHPVLSVDLVNGKDAILLDCAVEVWAPGRALILPAAALMGRLGRTATDGSEPLFKGLRMQVTGCDAVGSPPPLGSVEFPTKFEPDSPATWSVTERLPRATGASDNSATITAYWHVSFPLGNPYEHHLSFSPVWEVELMQPILLRQMLDDWVNPLRGIVALSTGRTEKITYLELTLEDDANRGQFQVFGANITQQPYAADETEVRKTKRAFVCYGADDNPRLLDLCRGWQRALQAHHPLIETLAAFMHVTRQHPRPRFLLLMQALEGLYGYEEAAHLKAQEAAHKEKLSQALAAIAACDNLDGDSRKFLKERLPSRPITNLETALKAAVDNMPADLSGKIKALELVQTVIADTDNQTSDWPAVLRVVRNDLSHGRRGWDSDLLAPAADVLETLARAHLMHTIGVRTSMIASFLDTDPEG